MPAADVQRVLMTADAVGGVWTYAMELAQGLASHGVDVVLAVLGPPPSDVQRAETRALGTVMLHEHPGRLEWMEDPWADVADAGRWLLDLEATTQPDIVHLNGYSHGALPWHAPTVVVGHSCVLSWWDAVRAAHAPPSWDGYAAAVRAGLQAADVVVAPSAAMMAALQHHYGPLTRTHVIANGRTVTAEPEPAKEPIVFSAGRAWDEAKNIQTLVDVAARLEWPLYVAGATQWDGDRLVAGRGARFLGRLDAATTAAWMRRASIYALPARYEPFGLSVLEAALARCALVLGDISSLREIWGDAAVFVAPDDKRMLEAAIRQLTADGEQREALASKAFARAQALSGARMTQAYVNVYQELAGAVRPVLSLSAV